MDVIGLMFDMGDVLFDDTLWRRWLFQLLNRMGLHTHYQAFFRVWDCEYLDEVHRGRRDYWDAMREFLASSGLTSPQADEVIAAGQARRRQIYQDIRPLPGVVAATAKLNAMGVPMAVLSNAPWPGERQSQLLDRLGLAGRFQPVLSSFDLGLTKPSPEAYCAAVEEMGFATEQIAFVGHHAAELEGARASGMPTIAVNHDDNAVADIYLEHIQQLPSAARFNPPRMLAG